MPTLPACALMFWICLPMQLNLSLNQNGYYHPYTDAARLSTMAASGSRRGLPSTPVTGNPAIARMPKEHPASWSASPAYDYAANPRGGSHGFSAMGGHGCCGGMQGVSH